MKDAVIVIGSSGHAKVVIELLQAMGDQVDFCVGDPNSASMCMGLPVLNGDEHLRRLRDEGYSRAFVAVGSNAIRTRLADLTIRLGFRLVNAVSPQAIISPSASLGEGVAVMAGAVINAQAVVEDLAIINTGATVDHDCRIGRGVHIAPQCGLAGNVIVGAGSLLGIGCKVIPNMRIGSEVTIGAGGVVVSEIPDGVVAVGVPARVVKR